MLTPISDFNHILVVWLGNSNLWAGHGTGDGDALPRGLLDRGALVQAPRPLLQALCMLWLLVETARSVVVVVVDMRS